MALPNIPARPAAGTEPWYTEREEYDSAIESSLHSLDTGVADAANAATAAGTAAGNAQTTATGAATAAGAAQTTADAAAAAAGTANTGLTTKVDKSSTYTGTGAQPGYWEKLLLDFGTLDNGTGKEPLYVSAQAGGTDYRTFWLNENGSPRGAAVNNEPALKIFGTDRNHSYAGDVFEVFSDYTRQRYLLGVHTDGRLRIGTAQTPASPGVVVLTAAAAVPAGLPAGTVIVRTP